MKKTLIVILAGLFVSSIVFGANNLYEYFNGNLPPLEFRGASECRIENYTGTAEQNAELLTCLEGKDVFGRPVGDPEPFFEIKHFSYQHSFDAGLATHGILRINRHGALTVTDGEFTGLLSASGAATFSSTLGVTGAVTLSSTLDVDGNTTLDKVTIAENLEADGGVIIGGNKDYGEKSSFSLAVGDICDYSQIDIQPTGGDQEGDGFEGASLSFPDDETLVAECCASAGNIKELVIYNSAATASTTAVLDIVTTDQQMNFASVSSDFEPTNFIYIKIHNYDGTSLSYQIDGGYIISD